MDIIETTGPDTWKRISLASIFLSYLELGLTAFGFTILQKLKGLVQKNAWLTVEEMNEGLALVQLYPGPIMVDFTAYVGCPTGDLCHFRTVLCYDVNLH